MTSCTGISAVWCPVCGDCECPRDEAGERTLESPACPLHAPNSPHGEDGEGPYTRAFLDALESGAPLPPLPYPKQDVLEWHPDQDRFGRPITVGLAELDAWISALDKAADKIFRDDPDAMHVPGSRFNLLCRLANAAQKIRNGALRAEATRRGVTL